MGEWLGGAGEGAGVVGWAAKVPSRVDSRSWPRELDLRSSRLWRVEVERRELAALSLDLRSGGFRRFWRLEFWGYLISGRNKPRSFMIRGPTHTQPVATLS